MLAPRIQTIDHIDTWPRSSRQNPNSNKGWCLFQLVSVWAFALLVAGILQMKDPTKKEDNNKQSTPDSVWLVAEVPESETPELPEVIKRAELPTEEILVGEISVQESK